MFKRSLVLNAKNIHVSRKIEKKLETLMMSLKWFIVNQAKAFNSLNGNSPSRMLRRRTFQKQNSAMTNFRGHRGRRRRVRKSNWAIFRLWEVLLIHDPEVQKKIQGAEISPSGNRTHYPLSELVKWYKVPWNLRSPALEFIEWVTSGNHDHCANVSRARGVAGLRVAMYLDQWRHRLIRSSGHHQHIVH